MDFGFLTDKEIKERGRELLGEYFDEEQAEGASYDLSLGEEVYISGQDYPPRGSQKVIRLLAFHVGSLRCS